MGIDKRPSRRAVIAGLAAISMFGLAITAGNKATAADPSQNIMDYVPEKLDDFTASMRVDRFDEHAGEKINKDFGYIYKLRGDVKLRYKEENKLRVDAQLGTQTLTLIVNNTIQYFKGGGLKTTMQLGTAPGKRKTLLDAGFISKGYLDIAQGEFKRMQEVKGIMCAQFRVSYKDKNLDTSHRLLWIDPKTKVVVKREEYSQQGKVNATYYYLQPKEIAAGVWFPTRIEVYNKDNEQAGVTVYRNIHVNEGLDENIFRM
jgi:outer membrane lipoprotein-sorting protein